MRTSGRAIAQRRVGRDRVDQPHVRHDLLHAPALQLPDEVPLEQRAVRVKEIVPYVRLIHSVASDSALRELERHRAIARPDVRILVEVNVAGEHGKAGVAPEQLGAFIARSPVPVAGLMTMPPLAREPDESRRWFAALRELADEHALEHLSMGTSQDYVVAVEEGATIVRIGTSLYT
jgi:PLP dependent protein